MTHVKNVDTPDLTEDQLANLVARFYEKVRADAALGPVFNGAIHDWPAHLQKLTAFWSSIMLTSGKYKGNPMAAHTKHADAIDEAMFTRWLALWAETTADVFGPTLSARFQDKAQHIAKSLKLALAFHAVQSCRQPG